MFGNNLEPGGDFPLAGSGAQSSTRARGGIGLTMFAIWQVDAPERFITDAETLDLALDKVDTMCRLKHDEAVAKLETQSEGYTFEIRNPEGTALATLSYHPDISRPYTSVVVEEMRHRT